MRWRTEARTLEEAMAGADIAFGLSAKGAFTREMVASMADKPIVFALANPDPEITPEEAREARSDAIICTGRSDYPNQVQQCAGVPLYLPGRAGCPCDNRERRDEDRRGPGFGRARARGCAG